MYSRRGRANLYNYIQDNITEYVLPYDEVDYFVNDSSDLNLDLTMIKIDVTNKDIILNCFNDKGIQNKSKKKILTSETVEVEST